jgi:hypothetical protein
MFDFIVLSTWLSEQYFAMLKLILYTLTDIAMSSFRDSAIVHLPHRANPGRDHHLPHRANPGRDHCVTTRQPATCVPTSVAPVLSPKKIIPVLPKKLSPDRDKPTRYLCDF